MDLFHKYNSLGDQSINWINVTLLILVIAVVGLVIHTIM